MLAEVKPPQLQPAPQHVPQQASRAYRMRWMLPLLGLLIFICIVVGGYRFHWKWTGFDGNTLWDWLQLLVLPVVLAGGGMWFNFQQGRISRLVAWQQHQTDLEIAENTQQEAALQAYLDHMSELLLDRKLRESEPSSGIREVAHARTLTAVWHVGHYRKGVLLKFLYEAGLILRDKAIVDLQEADLCHTVLRDTKLHHVDFHNVNLTGADLRGANLEGANLTNSRLAGADLSEANLRDADLTGADLTDAVLAGADITGAKLSGIDMSKVRMHEAPADAALMMSKDARQRGVTERTPAPVTTRDGSIRATP